MARWESEVLAEMPDGKHPGDPAAEVGVHEGSVDTTSAALICEISTLLKLAGQHFLGRSPRRG